MERYAIPVAGIGLVIHLLLLLAAGRLCGITPGPVRLALTAIAGGVYSWLCLHPYLRLLGEGAVHFLALAGMGILCFGWRSGLRCAAIFVLIALAMEGLAIGIGSGGTWSVLISMLGIGAVSYLGFREQQAEGYVDVELRYGDSRVKLLALRDTGNSLRDPVTGSHVLVVGADVAEKMTGLTSQQLRSPVETMGSIPGLRLIPYRTVGQPAGMLLGMRFPWVKIGKWQGSGIVAFAPDVISLDGSYQALTGGSV